MCVSGQVVYLNQDEGFLQASNAGLRFVAKNMGEVGTGDLVDISGLPELGGASPILRAATVRKTGHAVLPAATNLDPAQLSFSGWDATRVCVKATLIQMRETAGEQILDLESGAFTFQARLNANAAELSPLIPGSQLQLTGVYAARNGKLLSSANGAIFDLLVNSPEDVMVLTRPPWWTPQRMAMTLGVVTLLLLAALLWITQLRRRVEQRSRQLEEQIGRRKLLEQRQAMDNERQRIARDIHDDLGTGLTQIILACRHLDHDATLQPASRAWAQESVNRASALTRSMDEVVWTINPGNDSLESLMTYLNKSAMDTFAMADIRCRWDLPEELPDLPLTAEMRHNLFLAAKEAIHNIVKHSGATEVWIRLAMNENGFALCIEDNGKSFNPAEPRERGHGLQHMFKRLQESGGKCEIECHPGEGTRIRFAVKIKP